MYDYQALQNKLTTIMDDLREALTAAERDEVLGFIDAGEYGIALETLCSILAENKTKMPASTISKIEEVGTRMGLDPATWAELVRTATPIPAVPASPVRGAT